MANAGFYGKIPAQGDFVRVNAADPACLALDTWMAENLDTSQRGGIPLPNEAVNFFFRAPGSRAALVGAFSPSQDSVGRNYPMVVFALADLGAIGPRFPAVPVLFGSFLSAAWQIIAQGPQTTAARLGDQVRSMATPSANDVAVIDAVCRRTLDGTSALEVLRRMFGDLNAGRQYYGVRTFLSACETARGKEPPKTNVTLDCPIGADVDAFAWLELARRALRWSQPPSFFWTEGATPRLILPLGPPSASTLVYLAKPDHGGSRLWPLSTERADAIDAAVNQFPPVARRAIDDPNSTLEVLLSALAS